MNKPIPALDENGEFVVAVCHDGSRIPIYTLENEQGQIVGECRWWKQDGTSICESYPEMRIRNLDELRATVERAQRKREAEAKELNYDGSKWHEYTDCPKQTGCEYCLRARPTFAEALQAEASDAGDFRLMHMIERARHASEGP